jgi:hypothetical protein
MGDMGRQMTFVETIRAAVCACPLGFNALARKAGLKVETVWRFGKGERGIDIKNLDKLAAALGLRVVQEKAKVSRP